MELLSWRHQPPPGPVPDSFRFSFPLLPNPPISSPPFHLPLPHLSSSASTCCPHPALALPGQSTQCRTGSRCRRQLSTSTCCCTRLCMEGFFWLNYFLNYFSLHLGPFKARVQARESHHAPKPGLRPASCRQGSAVCLPWLLTPHLLRGLWDPKGAKDLTGSNDFPLFSRFKHTKS